MLTQDEKSSFHIVHCATSGTANDLREANYIFIANIGQIKLVTQSKVIELLDLQGALHSNARITF